MLLMLLFACSGASQTGDSGEEGTGGTEAVGWSYNLETKGLDFGEQTLGGSATQVIVVQNNGESDLLLFDLSVPEDLDLSITAPDSLALSRGEFANILVTWAPDDISALNTSASLVLGKSMSDSETVTVPITGSVSGATVVISTREYDFGDVNVGCSEEITVTITNTGNDDLSVDRVSINGDPSFEVDLGDFEVPMSLAPFQSLSVDVTYSPVANENDQAYLEVLTGADTVASAIEGDGAVDGEDEVTYEVGRQQRATALWHINEVAMPEGVSWAYFKEPFVDVMPKYFELMLESRAHFRVAFLWGTDGSVEGSTPYIDHTMSVSQAMSVWSDMLASGSTIGDNDRNFSSLIAGIEAQQDWLSEDEYWEEAKLSLITVQRDVEQSGGAWANYVSQAQAYKDDADLVTFHAIAGPPPNGCGVAEYFSGYYEAVIETDGLFLSVCEENWDAHIEKLVAASLGGGGSYFPLNGNPLESSIVVYIDDVRSSEGWEFDTDLNSIVFEDDYYPEEGAEIRIKYIKAVGCG